MIAYCELVLSMLHITHYTLYAQKRIAQKYNVPYSGLLSWVKTFANCLKIVFVEKTFVDLRYSNPVRHTHERGIGRPE